MVVEAIQMILQWLIVTIYQWINVPIDHHISAFSTKIQHNVKPNYISGSTAVSVSLTDDELRTGCRLGLDTHADVSCIGRHGRVMEVLEGQHCTVYPFNDSYKPMQKVEVVNAAFAVDTELGPTYILKVNQALDFTGSMANSLLCTNQVRANGLIVDDIPPAFDRLGNSTFSIYDPDKQIRLPLRNKGPIPHLNVRYPTNDDLDRCEYIELTSESEQWDPSDEDCGEVKSLVTQNCTYFDHENDFDFNLVSIYVASLRRDYAAELSPDNLSRLWNISLKDAQLTLDSTVNKAVRLNEGRLSRRYKTEAHQRQYKQLGGYLSQFYSDTFFSGIKSARGNTCIQLFTNKGGFIRCYPMADKSQSHHALRRFLFEIGIPSSLMTDNALELVQGEWRKLCNRHNIHMKSTEPHSPWQNLAESAGGYMKRNVSRLMGLTNTPTKFWDYCWEYFSEIKSNTATKNIYLNDRTPFEGVMGFTPDISELVRYAWYQVVWYHEPVEGGQMKLGRWLGPAHNSGQGLAYHIVTQNAKVITRSSISSLSHEELNSPDIKHNINELTRCIMEKLGDPLNDQTEADSLNDGSNDIGYDNLFPVLDDGEIMCKDPHQQINTEMDDMISQDDIMDQKIIGMKVQLPTNHNDYLEGTVSSRKRDSLGNHIGKHNPNPIMDTRIFVVKFGEDEYHDFSANVILENLYDQVDDDANSYSILKGIVSHKKLSNALKQDEGWMTTATGIRKRKITTKGWTFHVEWKDGTSTWLPLSILKNSDPVMLADYAVSREIHTQPAFAWWVPSVLRKRKYVIKQIQHRIPKKSMKFGITVPGSVEEAIRLDKENGNDLWQRAIQKEVNNVKIAFKPLSEEEDLPVGCKLIPYHIIYDVKFDLTRKARLVAGGHRNKRVSSHITFSTVASRDSIRIGFLLAALNGMDVLSGDISNAYLNAPNRENVYVILGKEIFGEEFEGHKAVIVRALYGLKSASAAWRDHFASAIRNDLKFVPCKGDQDMYYKLKEKNNKKYYSYLIIYVDDILCIDHEPKDTMVMIGEIFKLKPGSVEVPKMYLGTDVRQWEYQSVDGKVEKCYALAANSYVKEAIKVAKLQVDKHGLEYPKIKRQSQVPFSNSTYRPELDQSGECDAIKTHLYQNLIGVLRWICELGRVDILYEVSILSQYLASPRIGHVMEAVSIFYYLENHDRTWMVLDPTRFDIKWLPRANEQAPEVRAQVLKKMYCDAEDLEPPGMPEPHGESVQINVFVDSDHAGNVITRRSHTGIIIYLNLAPIIWYSKKQNNVESSTFGAEFIAAKTALEITEGLRYKLRMLGVPLEGPARVFCDNEAVVKSGSHPEITLRKKTAAIAFHQIREAVASSKILLYYEKSASNIADLFTKTLSKSKRQELIRCILS